MEVQRRSQATLQKLQRGVSGERTWNFLSTAFEPIDEFLRIWRLKRWRAWRQHDPINLLARYRANLKSLRGIYIDCGWRGRYHGRYHIHYGSRILLKRLSAVGIKHTYEELDDNHSDIDYRMGVSLPLPYKALKS